MEQFSLKKYLENPNRKVVTRYGRSARIICTNRLDETYPVIALVNYGYTEKYYSYSKFGKVYQYSNMDCELDLFFAPVKKSGWINLYKRNNGTYRINSIVYNSKTEANAHKGNDYIATLKIEWEE